MGDKRQLTKKRLWLYEGFLEASVKYLLSEEAALKENVTFFLDNYKWTFVSGLQLCFRQHFIISETCVFVSGYVHNVYSMYPGHCFHSKGLLCNMWNSTAETHSNRESYVIALIMDNLMNFSEWELLCLTVSPPGNQLYHSATNLSFLASSCRKRSVLVTNQNYVVQDYRNSVFSLKCITYTRFLS